MSSIQSAVRLQLLARFLLFLILLVSSNYLFASTLTKGAVVNGVVKISWTCTGTYCVLQQRINSAPSYTTIMTVNTSGNYNANVSVGNTYSFLLKTYTAGGMSGPVHTESDGVTVTPVAEEVLTISSISDKTILKNGTTGSIPFSITDTVTSGTLSIQVSSSIPSVIPLSGIIVSGSGASRTVSVTPAANKIGSSTIRITASKGGKTDYEEFTVLVNRPPLETSGPTNGELTVLWACTGNIYCVVKLKNSNSSSWGSGIQVQGTNGSVKFAISPGTFNIALEHWSAGGTTGPTLLRTDYLNKTIPNTVPVISAIADQNIFVNGSTASLAFNITDNETKPQNLLLTTSSSDTGIVLNNTSAIKIEGNTGTNSRSIKVTPIANRAGKSTISVTVSDGQLSDTETFIVTVNLSPPSALVAPANDIDGHFPVKWEPSDGASYYVLEQRESAGQWIQVYEGSELIYPAALTTGSFMFQVKACAISSMCSAHKVSNVISVSGSQVKTNRRVVFVHTDLLGSPAAETNEQGNENE